MPKYEGRVVKTPMIAKSCNFNNIVKKFYEITGIDPQEFWPTMKFWSTTVQTNNDCDTKTLLNLHHK